MVGVRRAVIAVLAVGLVVAGFAGWWLFTSVPSDSAEADPGSCAERADGPPEPPEERLLVCRYDATGALGGSALLPTGDADSAERALAEGPEGDPGCTPESAAPPTAVMVSREHLAVLSLDRVCSTYVLDGAKPRRMTPEVRAWAQLDTARVNAGR